MRLRPWELPVVPEDARIVTASGQAECDVCGKTLDEHPERVRYPAGTDFDVKTLVKGCDGKYYHL